MPIEAGKRVPMTAVWDERPALIVDLHKQRRWDHGSAAEYGANRHSEGISPCVPAVHDCIWLIAVLLLQVLTGPDAGI